MVYVAKSRLRFVDKCSAWSEVTIYHEILRTSLQHARLDFELLQQIGTNGTGSLACLLYHINGIFMVYACFLWWYRALLTPVNQTLLKWTINFWNITALSVAGTIVVVVSGLMLKNGKADYRHNAPAFQGVLYSRSQLFRFKKPAFLFTEIFCSQ